MYWLNLKALENQISNNELTEKDGFNYLLGYCLLSTISTSFSGVASLQSNTGFGIACIQFVLLIFITILGLKVTYDTNKDIDGKDFIRRFFAITWVIGFRIALVVLGFIFLAILIYGIYHIQQGQEPTLNSDLDDFLTMIIMLFITLISYILTIMSFRRLNPKSKE